MFVYVYIHACWWINPLRLELAVLVRASDTFHPAGRADALWEDRFYLFKFSAIAFLECLCGSKENLCPYLEFRQNLKRDSASKTRKKRLSLILYSEMVKKSSGSVSEGDHQRNNMVSFSIRIIHMSRIGLLLISCFLNTCNPCNELLRKNVRSDFFRYREWTIEKRKAKIELNRFNGFYLKFYISK